MNRFASKAVASMKPYVPVSERSGNGSEAGNVLKLDWNEATVGPSPLVVKAIHDFLISGRLNWYPATKNGGLLDAIANYVGVPTECVQYFAGSDDLHEYILRAFVDVSDTVLIIAPTYDSFRAVAESAGAETEAFWLGDTFGVDLAQLHEKIDTSQPKLVYLCNPNNPTGTEFSRSDVVSLVQRHPDSLFVIDEAYVEFGGESAAPVVPHTHNCLVTRTFSKAFALASLRIGYAVSAVENIQVLDRVRNPKSVSMISQIAASAALSDLDYMRGYVAQVAEAKAWFVSELFMMGIAGYAGGGNFVLVDPGQRSRVQFVESLESRGVFVRNLSHLPRMQNFLRVTVGTMSQMRVVANGFRAAIAAG